MAPLASSLRPPGFFRGPVWPVPLSEAEALVAPLGHGPQAVGKYCVKFLIYASSLAATGTESNLLKAYDLFKQIARYTMDREKWGPEIRAAALQNSAAVLAQFKSKRTLRMAAKSAADAMDALGALDDKALAALVESIAGDSAAVSRVEPLEWDAGRLVPQTDLGRARLSSVPLNGFEGTWNGVRGALHGYGLGLPDRPYRNRSCRIVPKETHLEVR